MYELMVRRDFIAQHFLTVPNCGPENEWHSHHFTVDVRLAGDQLNEHGYLVDIDDVKAGLDGIESRYKDATLNELPEFEGLNPSVEHFCRFCCERMAEHVTASNVTSICIRIWEDDEAWASYEIDRT
jgi:6-pyruvoyltetrahydropterin/6-carboxytetrahydropterin synthase